MWQTEIFEKFNQMHLQENVLLKQYTYTKTGGNAEVLALPKTIDELQQLLKWSNNNKLPITVLGNGSNVIVKDSGISGIVILLENMTDIVIKDTTVIVASGAKLVDVSKKVGEHGLTGLEFACGIPGSVGGAIYMNAGAYGGEMVDVVSTVQVVTRQGDIKTYTNEELKFGYRKSLLQETNDIVVSVTIDLKSGKKVEILSKMDELNRLRREKQPLEYPSCGSVFKRPPGYFAGALIQQSKLQGHRIGGVEVSKKHAGFMVNVANGTAEDYKQLIAYVQRVVFEKTGVTLEPEVRFIGD